MNYKLDLNDKNSVLNFLESNGIIEASAGTGKTYTIIELVKNLILEKNIKPEEILIVTFTEKATGELKDRIFKKFDELTKDSSQIVREKSKDIVNNINNFEIHTIHSFCNKLIKEYPFEIGCNFENSIIDDSYLIEEYFFYYIRKDIFNEFEEDVIKDIFSIIGFDDDNPENKIKGNILDYIKKVKYIFNFIEKKILKEDIISSIRNFKKINFTEIEEKINTSNINKRSQSSIINKINKLKESDINNFIEILDKELIGYYFDKEEIIDLFKDIGLYNYYENGINLKNLIVDYIATRVYQLVDKHKKDNFLIAFDDMILYVYRAIKDSEVFKKRVQEAYRYAFIDEFQDTDPVQWEIFKKIFLDNEKNRLIIIGDPKQSIYLFRNACLDVYFEAKEYIVKKNGLLAQLDTIFRSTESLIDGYNGIFALNNYFENSQIQYSNVNSPQPNKKIFENIKPINFIKLLKEDRGKQFCRFIAGEIKKLIDDNSIKIYDEKNDNCRNVLYSDIAILVSSRDDAANIQRYLSKNGIPSSFYKKNLLFQSKEAIQIFYLLDYWADMGNIGKLKKLLLTDFYILSEDNIDEMINKEIEVLQKVFDSSKPENMITTFFNTIRLEEVIGIKYRSNYKRVVINYRHIAEKLENIAFREKLDIFSLKNRLLLLIYSEKEEEIDEDLFRNEGKNENVVSILTIHASKGLEFPIVFDYGALKGIPGNKKKYYYSELKKDYTEHIVKYSFTKKEKDKIGQKEIEEYRRLHYVAITRGEYSCYLPVVEMGNNSSLACWLGKNLENLTEEENYKIINIDQYNEIIEFEKNNIEDQNKEEILTFNQVSLDEIYKHDRFFTIKSFSSLKKFDYDIITEKEYNYKEDENYPIIEELINNLPSLPGGTKSGSMLHKILEKIDYSLINRDEIDKTIEKTLKYYSITFDNEKLLNIKNEIKNTFNILVNKKIINDFSLKDLKVTDRKNELDFYFYVDENFINGEIDLLFRYNNRYYIVDWKSNKLEENETPESNFKKHYEVQAKIYTYAMKKYLEKNVFNFSYEKNFGGIFYIYLRIINENNDNGIIYNNYPANEIEDFYTELKEMIKSNKEKTILELKEILKKEE
ncbi:MAG TPA: UvrD-helicase domain-containing protein [Spirochaetota bacterium]|nr:UvrD-helicase domain-containing protein [Spirochaetota bacterium]HOL57447.1 UvrD-helicase domain-containing protein [Spirochaetota bacterium]HPP04972.1 UvrD-helicase domain-containing protein [Spirochaetota bacterium]